MTNPAPLPAGPWQIHPFHGLEGVVPDSLPFGARRDVLARRLTTAYGDRLGERSTFRKSATSLGLCDAYHSLDLILHHDAHQRLAYLELFASAPAEFDGVGLLDRPYGDVLDALRARGWESRETDAGHEIPAAGFNLTARPEGDEAPVYCVGVQPDDRAGMPPPRMTGGVHLPGITAHRLLPFEGTETVRLGQDRRSLRARLGATLACGPDGHGAGTDRYFDHGLELTFDSDDRLVTLAIGYTGHKGTATLAGVQLLDRPYAQVAADLARAGIRVVRGELSAELPDHGIRLHMQAPTNPELPVVAVVYGAPTDEDTPADEDAPASR
ncbi:hypothetical protein ACF06W_12575 [Streptomyces albus]|uniref:hypothetical protein n=1 Tax=Streptomyces albus TaxID=1888 RepID=UPI0036F76450